MIDPIVKPAGEKLRASDVLNWLDAHPGATIVVTGIPGKSAALEQHAAVRHIVEKGGLKNGPLERGRTDVR